MAEPAQSITVTVDADDNSVRTDHATGNVETDTPDGGVVVAFGAAKKQQADGEDDWFRNLADDIDASKLATIANDLIDAIQADDNSRQGWLATRARGMDILGLEVKEPRAAPADGAGVEGMSTVTNPLLLETILKGWATAQAELLPASGPVKIKDDGEETVAEDDLADALERDMNHWFTTTASEFYPDTSHMILWGPYFGGSGVKKIYRCPMRRRPVSESIDMKDFIVSDTTKDLRSCGRITHQITMRPSVMKRMKLAGHYRDVELTQPTPTTNAVAEKVQAIQGTAATRTRPEDEPYTLWETQCELDLDDFIPNGSKFKGKEVELPFLVTLDKDSREILAIRRDWSEDDQECERLRMYVKYPYVPGPGFYGTGMLNILGNSSLAMTAAWREALDAGMYASFPGGLIAKLAGRQNSAIFRMAPGQFEPVETNGMPINQIIMPSPYRDPTPGLMTMIDKVTAQAKEVGGVADIPAAEGIQNVPVGTMLAQIEQATKIMAAAHKGMHQALSEELELILDLFRVNPEDFWRSNKIAPAGYWNEQKFLQALDDCMLIPVSDPNVPSHIHRIAKALGLVQLIQMPVFTPIMSAKETLLRCLRAMREDSVGLVIDPPPQQPGTSPEDAKIAAAQATVQAANAKAAEAQAKLQMIPVTAQVDVMKLQTEQQTHQQDLQREAIIHQGDMVKAQQDQAIAAREHGLEQVKVAADLQQQQHDQSMDVAGQRLDAAKAAHDAQMDVAQHGLDRQQHSLDVAQAGHEQRVDAAQHALDVHQALHPPKPATPKKQ